MYLFLFSASYTVNINVHVIFIQANMVLVGHFISSSNQLTGLVKEHLHGPDYSQEVPPLILFLKHKAMKMVSLKLAMQTSLRAQVFSTRLDHIFVIAMILFRWEYW